MRDDKLIEAMGFEIENTACVDQQTAENAARAALDAAEAAGYRLVPREPEPERIRAMDWQIGSGVKTWGTTRAIYDAAIAAPQPEAAPEVGRE